jgi:hypothetical protein
MMPIVAEVCRVSVDLMQPVCQSIVMKDDFSGSFHDKKGQLAALG